MAAGNDTVNIKVKYIPDTSALKNIKEIRMPEIKIGGKDAGKGVFDSYNNAIKLAKKFGWIIVSCETDGNLKSIEEINEDILDIAKELLEKNMKIKEEL